MYIFLSLKRLYMTEGLVTQFDIRNGANYLTVYCNLTHYRCHRRSAFQEAYLMNSRRDISVATALYE
jgi:hypothetical protein